jgi:cysteinyl-tRNA synthetase
MERNMMKLYNARTRTIEDFTPLNTDNVRMYSCGPTVYDHAHIGNLSAFIFADTLRRALTAAGYGHITHAMNYTDVDDKTIRRSHERYPEVDANEALSKLTDEYIALFLHDMERVGNDTHALSFLRATDEHVLEGMRELIAKLYKRGFAYIADDGIYFSIDAYRKSGKTYGQLLELTLDNTSESRIQNDEYDKESAHDFALWKKAKPGEPSWPFELDHQDMTGRPGWHIECSVMSRQLLDQPFDIHTGGVDLIFPHHENEIAQSTACEVNPVMATFFAHNAHILVDGKKMSKSANNFYTLQDIVDRGYDPLAFRLLVLQSHYRSQAHFSWENLDGASNRLKRYRNFAVLRYQVTNNNDSIDASLIGIRDQIVSAITDDLDTPKVLLLAEQYIDRVEKIGLSASQGAFEAFLTLLDQTLGLQLMAAHDISNDLKRIVAAREKARSEKDWKKSDELRTDLEKQGIGVRDSADKTAIWCYL